MLDSVDVIILSWDRERETLAAIRSAESQSDVDVNIIVVDQGSKPKCKETLKKYCLSKNNIQWIENSTNSGVPAGRNTASFAGASDLIVALDNDAEFEHEHVLRDALSEFNRDNQLAVACFRVSIFQSQDIDHSSWAYGIPADEWGHKDFYTTRFVGAGHAIRRDLFERVKGYDDTLFFLHEEVELARRFINLGYTIRYFPHLAVGHKVSAERRVSWDGGRWFYHVRNKSYLALKYRTNALAAIFHILLLIRDGISKKQFSESWKAVIQGISMYRRNRTGFVKEECRFNADSEQYYRENTPGASGSIFTRIKRRLGQS